MPFVVTVAGQKGGAGKTTLAVNLAEAFRVAGRRVVLIDTDPQGSARLWRDFAEEGGHGDAVLVVGATGLALRSTIAGLEASADVFVIDTPPRMAQEARAAMALASIVVVPVSPGPSDVWALEQTAATLAEVRATRADGGPRALAVLNRTDKRTAFGQALPEAVRAAGFDVATTQLANRVAYPEAMASGQGVITYASSSVAADEVRELVAEVLR